MVFSSPWFFLFLSVLLTLLALPLTTKNKKHLLAVASCFFYAAWDYRYVALLLSISVVDYVAAARLHALGDGERRRKVWLAASIVTNLGVLAYFKYTNFFIDNVNTALGSAGVHLDHLDILLPAGVSFYTFKTMSYVIDVYRREIEPVRSWLDYATFITFFPELIAGPIVRASVFLPQMDRPIGPTVDRFARGASIFLLGFTKKIMADRFGTMVSPVFTDPAAFDVATLWVATFGYAFQIYCDFSGYSDMAVGTAKIIGYDLPENFNMPYLSANVSEFWRRWHITLSTWLRDYLYIPLGGNRRGNTYVNLSATMLLGGLWHGASWNFILWGALHGGALAVHRFLKQRSGGRALLPTPLAVAVTFLFAILCWIPFRCATFAATTTMLSGLFGASAGQVRWITPDFFVMTALIVAGHIAGTLLGKEVTEGLGRSEGAPPSVASAAGGAPQSALRARPHGRSEGAPPSVASAAGGAPQSALRARPHGRSEGAPPSVASAAGGAPQSALRARPHGRSRITAWISSVGRLEQDAISGWYVRLGAGTMPGAYVVFTWTLLAFLFSSAASNPFIYFQF